MVTSPSKWSASSSGESRTGVSSDQGRSTRLPGRGVRARPGRFRRRRADRRYRRGCDRGRAGRRWSAAAPDGARCTRRYGPRGAAAAAACARGRSAGCGRARRRGGQFLHAVLARGAVSAGCAVPAGPAVSAGPAVPAGPVRLPGRVHPFRPACPPGPVHPQRSARPLRPRARLRRPAGSAPPGPLGGALRILVRHTGSLGPVRRFPSGPRCPAPRLAASPGAPTRARDAGGPPMCDARHRTTLPGPA